MHSRGHGSSRLICILAAALSGPLPAEDKTTSSSSGPRSPKDPPPPSVDLRDLKEGKRETNISSTIVNARGDKKTGSLEMQTGSIEVTVVEERAHIKTAVAIADIDSIEITRWRPIERRRNEFVFYPAEIRIVLRDRKTLLCAGSVPLLNRLSFKDSGGSRFVYSYFFDYWKHDAWKNCGRSDKSYPETNPPDETLVKIVFIREEMKNPLEKLLSR